MQTSCDEQETGVTGPARPEARGPAGDLQRGGLEVRPHGRWAPCARMPFPSPIRSRSATNPAWDRLCRSSAAETVGVPPTSP